MLPVLRLMGREISTYWLMFAVGVVMMAVLAVSRRARYKLKIWQALLFTLFLTVCGLAGTKILYILESWPDFLEKGLTLGGLSFFGAVYLIPLLMWLPGRLFSMNYGQSLDCCAPCLAVMVAFMRIGCFLNGCCGGWEVTLGGLRFAWPTQIMEGIGDFIILSVLLQMEEERRYPGKRYGAFLVGYGILRFFLEFLRDTQKDWLHMSHGQWFALAAVLLGSFWMRRRNEDVREEGEQGHG